jgi:hypothetical protein
MSRTQLKGSQILENTIQSIDIEDGGIWREDLNTTSTGKAIVTKLVAGADISLDSTGVDDGTGEVTINFTSSTGGITATQHRLLDQLVHEIAENSYCEIERTGGRVSSVLYYTDSGKSTKIREINYTRTVGRISQIEVIQYNSGGSPITGETYTGTITRSGGRIQSIDWVLS